METLALITLSLVILNIAFNMIFFHFLSQNQIRILKKIQETKKALEEQEVAVKQKDKTIEEKEATNMQLLKELADLKRKMNL